MKSPEIEKMEQLEQLAEADEVCRQWRESCRQLEADFNAYAGSQPAQIYRMLHSFREAERMLHCRKLLLACKYMDFKEDEN